ncbi:MAG: hypothetical protein ACLP2Y_05115 [Limisphaerales bacterium]
MLIILFCVTLAVALNLPMVLRSSRLRRFAQAKLDIVRTVNEMDKLMLNGDLTLGSVCHDRVYQNMLRSQYATHYIAPWRFWKFFTPEMRDVQKGVHAEMSGNTPLSQLMARYGDANFRAFRYNRPFASVMFMWWVLIFAGGLTILFVGVFSLLKIKEAWKNFKRRSEELYVASNSIQAA